MPMPEELSPDQLRWNCDPNELPFETTAEVDPATSVQGQQTAREALLFGIQCDAPGQNIYVRGPRGTGRSRMVHQLLAELELTTDRKRDRCYVHNFKQPDHPRLISLPPGQAVDFKREMAKLAEFAREGLRRSLNSEPLKSQREAIKQDLDARIKQISQPLEQDLSAAGMTLVSTQQGPVSQTNIFPVVDGQPVPVEQLKMLVAQEKVDAAVLEKFETEFPEFQKRLQQVAEEVNEEFQQGSERMEKFVQSSARSLVQPLVARIKKRFTSSSDPSAAAPRPGSVQYERAQDTGDDCRGLACYLDDVLDDIIENRLISRGEDETGPPLDLLYGVNIVLSHSDPQQRPVIEENTPSVMNLVGSVESQLAGNGMAVSDYSGIRAGRLLEADQGYLLLDVNDLLNEPGAYRALMRTLRTGTLEIVPPEVNWMRPTLIVQPQPIPIRVRVILIGDASTYYRLDHIDPDFREQFKVLADFDNELPRALDTITQYASVVSYLCQQEQLPPFDRSAIAKLAEHGARIVSRGNRLTARLGRIADIAREASFVCQVANENLVSDEHINLAIRRTKQRASMPSRKFQELVEQGTIIVKTQGSGVGQVNGLAVMRSGPLTYGFPARITASIGPGSAGLINIEGRAQMSGSIHTKGFHILGGLLRNLLKTEHPLAFSASIAFEQSYGGIDGDSASGAEMCCLLSALTNVPIKQSMSMTGAIDQLGNIQAIGGVNEKIEGFFDACNYFGLTGDQGVVIPQANAGDLMLRVDVVDACRKGNFHIYAVSNIFEALHVLTGTDPGTWDNGTYTEGSILQIAIEKAAEFWKKTLSSPRIFTETETEAQAEQNRIAIESPRQED